MLLPGKNGLTEGEPVYTQIQIHDLQLLKDRKDPKLVSFVYSHLAPEFHSLTFLRGQRAICVLKWALL